MAAEPFRFLHVARVQLDQSLVGLRDVPERLRTFLRDATLASFDNLIAAALDLHVDAVLISGDLFPADDASVRGPARAAAGFTRLDQRGIQVFVVPGANDPFDSWLDGIQWPGNVHFLTEQSETGIELSVLDADSKRPLAILGVDAVRLFAVSSPAINTGSAPSVTAALRAAVRDAPPGCFVIGLAAATTLPSIPSLDLPFSRATVQTPHVHDAALASVGAAVWALGGERRLNQTIDSVRLMAPGSLQGTSAAASGSRGANLVVVEPDGELRVEFVPTAAVRWETVSVTLGRSSDRDDCILEMLSALEQFERASNDRVMLVRWELDGDPESLRRVQEPDFATELELRLDEESRHWRVEVWTTGIHVRDADLPLVDPADLSDEQAAQYAEFVRGVEEHWESPGAWMAELLIKSSPGGGSLESRLAPFANEISPAEVRRRLHQAARTWFAPPEETH
jgi:DNA repair exonuclease SbcCD nuclease subunit